ncbi:NADH-quinone oxidoreductase subunit J family protein [Flavobacterium aciduliphilum]|jgi:NADH-quinone oxidoreductase subunit J|uniref:NADH-quinone oxidoreductase subunit J n=1 Tax=Flavobacterium aciduliphilum TaxID=1101402 RepID=A0A328YGH4_9FLAO|nr:NADH-quinone oxidoreductase subunit J [Flavobacterium aciduliphilum]RAR72750.1 NADH dehydrogenase subunit J [Flavobacterium aciduliphilum]
MAPVLIIFYVLAAITLASAFLTIYSRNPIHSAIYLVICMVSIMGHYLLFNAQFLALVQLIVYAGAIMVLFLFTIMLMNLNKEDEVHKPRITRLGAITVLVLLSTVLLLLFRHSKPFFGDYAPIEGDFQSIKKLGTVLLDNKDGFMVPFEFTSVLLLVAMIGAVLLSKKEKQTK